MTVLIPARPTTYRGIDMRSRLEADVAAWLDGTPWPDIEWKYEPQCFASERGQYLPDFAVNWRGEAQYWEIKPQSYPPDKIDGVLSQMEIIWDSKPDAGLVLHLWEYGHSSRYQIGANGTDRVWWFQERSLMIRFPWSWRYLRRGDGWRP